MAGDWGRCTVAWCQMGPLGVSGVTVERGAEG